MRILSVNHGPSVHGGLFDEAATAAGHDVERWVTPIGGTPQPAASYGAIMVFGGSMDPDEDEQHAWMRREEQLLREALADDVPVLGVCLGAQMLARAAGAPVGPAPAAEFGWVEVELTREGRDDTVLGVLPERAMALELHSYTFDVHGRGTELARSQTCSQAFRVGERAWGIQFHAEATLQMVRTWIDEEPDELPVSVPEFLAETERRMETWNDHGRRLAAAFLRAAES